MPRFRVLPAALAVLALVAPAVVHPRTATAQAAEAVIPSQSDRFFLDATNPAPGTFPGGWRLKSVRIQFVSALVTYADPAGRTAVIELVHPTTREPYLATSGRFALTAPDPAAVPPGPLVEALARRLIDRESRFAWVRQIRSDAVPIDPMNRPRYHVTDPGAAARLQGALQDLQAGRRPEAVRTALQVATPTAGIEALRFAAQILREAGEAQRALAVLDPALAKASGTADEVQVLLDRMAVLETLGDRPAASAIAHDLSSRFRQRYPDPRCVRAYALALLLQVGQIAEAAKAAPEGPDPLVATAGAPLCVHLYRIRAASAAGDSDGVEAAARAALEAYPDDPNVLFLWGTYFYIRNDQDRALPPWDRLAAIDPTFPSLMSQYGTAYLVAGRLDPPGIEQQLARLRENPGDVVAAYLAGLGLYYQKEYAQVIPLLALASKAVPNDPRPKMYLAMAYFFMGQRDVTRKMMDELEPFAYQEPDINYCRSLVYRSFDLPRAIKEMTIFLDVFEGENRLRFGQQKVDKARSDLERMKRGQVPDVWLPQPDGPDPRFLQGPR